MNADVTSRMSPGPAALLIVDDQLIQADASVASAREIRFPNVMLPGRGSPGERLLRFTNIRVNPSTMPAGSSTEVSATFSATNGISVDFPVVSLGEVSSGHSWDTVLPSSGVPSGTCAAHNQALLANSAASGGVVDFSVRIGEFNRPNVFRPRADGFPVPGITRDSESGYYNTSLPATNGLNRLGLADSGTRLRLEFRSIPAGMKLYVTTGPVEASTTGQVGWLRLVTGDGTPVAPTTSATWNGKSYGIAPVDSSSLSAEWEVTGSNPHSNESYLFGVVAAYPNGLAAANLPKMEAMLGPSSTTSLVPRFTSGGAAAFLPLSPCTAGIDLIPTSVSFVGSVPGLAFEPKVGLVNRGSLSSGPFGYSLRVTSTTGSGGTEEYGTYNGSVDGLGPGEYRLVTARYRPSAFSAQVAPSRGATVTVTVDPAQQISETDRTNNVFVSQSAGVTCSTSPFGNVAASAAGGTYPLPLLNDSGCPVWAPGPMAAPPWVGLAGSGTAFELAANTQPYSRSTFVFPPSSYAWFQVQQASADPGCSTALASGDLSTAPATGAVRTLMIQTGAGCKWSAVSNTRMASPAAITFTGPGPLPVTIRPNFSSRSRQIPVAVGTWSGIIPQAGNSRPAAERLVQLVYHNFFGRLPNETEIATQAAVARSTGEREFLMRFLNSDEFDLKSRYIAGLYVGLLARDAEYNGFAFQRDALITGIASAPQLVSNFLTSQEYALRFGLPNNGDFVRLLYANILLRTPSEAEVIGHAANLTAGQSRAQLASNFLSSPEFRLGAGPRLLGFLLYAGILGREGSQFDLDGAASLISQGLLSTAIARLVDSPEFAATVLE